MAQILVRDLDDRIVKRLKARARRNGRSLQAEVKSILERSAQSGILDTQSAWKRIDAIRNSIAKEIGGTLDDSSAIIRKDRDRQ